MPVEVKIKDFCNWVMEQDDKRPVNMHNATIDYEGCGCVMVQYAEEENLPKFECCEYTTWEIALIENDVLEYKPVAQFEDTLDIQDILFLDEDGDTDFLMFENFKQLKDRISMFMNANPKYFEKD